MHDEIGAYERQGFGADFELKGPTALLVVDCMVGFADPAVFGGGNIPQAIERTVGLLAAARERGWLVAYSRMVYADDDSDRNVFAEKVPSMLTQKERSQISAIVPQLAPRSGELIVRKTVPSAFFGTMLAPWLIGHGIRTIVVAGAVTSGCVRASVVDAMSHGFRPLVADDCVGDRALAPHEANLFDMRQKYAVVMPRDEVLRMLPK